MSQSEKASIYQELKRRGQEFSKHYREYSTTELGAMLGDEPMPTPVEQPRAQSPVPNPAPLHGAVEMAGERLNVVDEDEVVYIDENGLEWFQKEIPKPAYPKPRGRRVLRYKDSGTKTQTVTTGDRGQFIETFEVSGELGSRQAEVKITLPSYQVGKYRDPRYPFKIWVYAEARGFDLFEVRKYYGDADLVPEDVRLVYVDNVLCYDMRSTIRTIQAEHRQLQLAGKVK